MTVYFLECDGFVKIGYTEAETPEGRVYSMRTGNPHPITVLAYGDGDTQMETWLHAHFSEQRRSGEWFEPNNELVRAITYVSTMKSTRGLQKYLGARLSEIDDVIRASWLETELRQQKRSAPVRLDDWGSIVRFAFEDPDLEHRAMVVLDGKEAHGISLQRRGRFSFWNRLTKANATTMAEAMVMLSSSDERLAYWVVAGLHDAAARECVVIDGATLMATAMKILEANPWHGNCRNVTLDDHGVLPSNTTIGAAEFLFCVAAIRNAVFAQHSIVIHPAFLPEREKREPIMVWVMSDHGARVVLDRTEAASGAV